MPYKPKRTKGYNYPAPRSSVEVTVGDAVVEPSRRRRASVEIGDATDIRRESYAMPSRAGATDRSPVGDTLRAAEERRRRGLMATKSGPSMSRAGMTRGSR